MLLNAFIDPVSVDIFSKMDLSKSNASRADLVSNKGQITNYKCELCPKEYTILMRLHRHKNDHKNGTIPLKVNPKERVVWKKGKYECEMCQKIMAFHYELKKHQKLEHEEADLSCMYCERKFYEKRDLSVHTKKHTGEKPHQCSMCTNSYADRRALQSHLKAHIRIDAGQKLHSCPICEKKFSQSGALSIHKVKHSDAISHTCSKCDKSFSSKYSLKEHSQVHLDSQPLHFCTICGFETKIISTLKSHTRIIHRKALRKTFRCEECNFVMRSRTSLTTHIQVKHLGNEEYSCSQCEFKSGYDSSLRKHMNYIHNAAQLKCDLCKWEGKGNRLKLSRHQKSAHQEIKENAKVHQCDLCENAYSRKEHLKKHREKTHLGVRYQCHKCQHMSTTSTSLKIHIKSIHDQVKSLCPHCDHKAHDNSSLAKHIKSVHLGLRPHSCQVCGLTFTTKLYLVGHEKRSHTMAPSL